jgi:hypothetical protein
LVLVFVFQVLARLAFQGLPLVPHFVEFNPSAALIPASGYFLGPLGACASLAATVLADQWTGMWTVFSLFKAAGVFFAALTAWTLRSSGPLSLPGFTVVGLLSLPAAAAWPAAGAEVLRLYPFTYFAALLLVHHALFFLLLVPGLWGLGNRLRPISGGSAAARFYVVGGSAGAVALGMLISAVFYRMWPFERYHLSDHAGLSLVFCIAPLLALHAAGLVRAWIDPTKGGMT